ncbi:MAG: RNase H family protein [Chloroflexota bacterium]
MTAVTLFGDGSCRGNPGPGGYCVVMQAGGREKVLVGGDDWTTNNRMELTAVLMGLHALRQSSAQACRRRNPCVRLSTSSSTALRDGSESVLGS